MTFSIKLILCGFLPKEYGGKEGCCLLETHYFGTIALVRGPEVTTILELCRILHVSLYFFCRLEEAAISRQSRWKLTPVSI